MYVCVTVYVFWGRGIGRGTIYIVVLGRCFDTIPIIILINQHHFAIHAETDLFSVRNASGRMHSKCRISFVYLSEQKPIEHIKIEFAMCSCARESEYKMYFFPGSPIQTNKRISCCDTTMA